MKDYFELLYYEKIFDYLFFGIAIVVAIIWFIVFMVQVKIHNKKIRQEKIKYKYKRAMRILKKRALIFYYEIDEIAEIQKQTNCKYVYLKYMPHEIVLFIEDKELVFRRTK